MFIKNFTSLKPKEIIWVGNKTRNLLLTKGFCELSKNDNKWAFSKTKNLEKIINTYKKEGGDLDD